MISTNTIQPKISVIVAVLNMQQYIASALDSVIRQNYSNLELIVIDGGSTDGTLDIIKQYQQHLAFWKSEKDKGHCDAVNKALDYATGDFIIMLNADDTFGENLLNKVAETCTKNPSAKIITCGVQIFKKDANNKIHISKEISSPGLLQITLHNMLFELPVINARFFHKDIFQRFGKFIATHADGTYNLSNDRDFLSNIALAGIQTEIIPEPLYIYFSHEESLTFNPKNHIKIRKEHLKLAEKFLTTKTLTPQQKKIFKSWQANESAYLCLLYAMQAMPKEALITLKYGILKTQFMWINKLLSIVIKFSFKIIKRKIYGLDHK
jgi:glycosyltransferase involved in cell wall biosynthesis